MTTRFDWMLPKFLTGISDFRDLLQAEDEEFQKIENRFLEVSADSTLETLVTYDSLQRLERIFALPGVSVGLSFQDRVQRVKAKLAAYETTTTEALERLAERIMKVPARVVEKNEDYSFTVVLTVRELRGLFALVEAIHEVKPAHLGFDLGITFFPDKLHFAMLSRRYKELTVEWSHYRGGTYRKKWFLGGTTLKGRTLTVPPSTFDKSKVSGNLKIGGFIRIGRWLTVCSLAK